MAHPLRMPRPGQMTEECTLLGWQVKVGDRVAKGDVLFEIETDKAVMEVEAFEEGVLLKRLVEDGETVPVNTICGYIGEEGESVPDAAPEPEPVASGTGVATADSEPEAPTQEAPRSRAARPRVSPRASRLAAEVGVDPRTVTGSGPGGRIVERDIRATISDRAVQPQAAVVEEETGEARPLSRVRRVIAQRMTESATTIPQFTVTVAVDVTRLIRMRQDLRLSGVSLTVTDFLVMAAAQTLVEMPDVNSRTDGLSVWPRRRVHIGLAVSLPEGLVVPVIRDADRLTLDQLHDRAATLATAAREGRLAPDDMSGSTFTISNLGMFAVEQFTAIINPGESAILAVGSIIPTPVVREGGFAVRSIMRLTLTADHRMIDGELAARFLNAVRARLEAPQAMRPEV